MTRHTEPPATPDGVLRLPQPYLLFLGDATEPGFAKTAFGLRDWAPERCVGEWSCGGSVTLGLTRLRPRDASAHGARALLIGVANIGGAINDTWLPNLFEALESGLDLVAGLHTRLNGHAGLRACAERFGRHLYDVRTPPASLPIGTGRKRSGKRLLTVGTDCALGKKYTALALARAFQQRGVEATFRATGQTGIMISGSGIPMDAVVADFAAGAAELLSPDAPATHWDVVEGQGSLFHPGYAGVSLALLHGSQPDVIVVCHQPGRTLTMGNPAYPLPSIEETIALNLTVGRRTNPAIRCAGVSLDTSRLAPAAAAELLASETLRLKLPVADPMRGGTSFERLVDACLA